MKKVLAIILSLNVLVLMLSGCGAADKPVGVNASAKSTVVTPLSVKVSSKKTPTKKAKSSAKKKTKKPSPKSHNKSSVKVVKGIPFNLSNEPPLNKYEQKQAVPNFLTKEQQNLYRRACSLYFIFRGSPSNIDNYPRLDGSKCQPFSKNVTIDGDRYYISQGRYQHYKDFESVIFSVFTQDFYKIHNDGGNKYSPAFRSLNGKLCYLDADMGDLLGYVEPDTFKLISKTNNQIRFNVIGHCCASYRPEDRNDVRTASLPITLVRTQNGWRFSEFHSAEGDWPITDWDQLPKADASYKPTGP